MSIRAMAMDPGAGPYKGVLGPRNTPALPTRYHHARRQGQFVHHVDPGFERTFRSA